MKFIAQMVELVDTQDLKSCAQKACGFDSRSGHTYRFDMF